MTARAMAGDTGKCLSARMDGYVSKPVRVDLLRSEIDRLARPHYVETLGSARKKEKHVPKLIMGLSELLERVENDRELIRELLLIFKEEFPIHLRALRDAVDYMDGKRVAAEAHTMKGMLSNLAAGSAASAAAGSNSWGGVRKCPSFRKLAPRSRS